MHYAPRDRCPIIDFGFWEETLVRWRGEGLPEGMSTDEAFGMDPHWHGAPVNTWLSPGFETEVLEDRPDRQVVRDGDGVTKVVAKDGSSIPTFLDHTLKDRASWERDVRWRLDGRDPARYPPNWPSIAERLRDPERDVPVAISGGSLYGKLRDLMGVEALSVLVYDDRALFDEMVETVATCVIDSITPALQSGVRFDYAMLWEDMCYRAGPLLTPRIFRETLVPQYRRITDLLGTHGVDVVVLDCDGDIRHLVPLWLEAGVNCMFPIEVGTWGADPIAYRREYGRDLLMIGGVDKRVLAGPTDGIRREVERLAPLVEEGGYIPTPDHRVPPDVPLANYVTYLRCARAVWGRELPNLRPMACAGPAAL